MGGWSFIGRGKTWRKMSGGVYGGDEVGALVFDVGSCTTRAGYAGEDCPKADIPTAIGVGPGPDIPMETDESTSVTVPVANKKYYIDNTVLGVPREDVEIISPIKDGLSMFFFTHVVVVVVVINFAANNVVLQCNDLSLVAF
jgi:hypothetical protein